MPRRGTAAAQDARQEGSRVEDDAGRPTVAGFEELFRPIAGPAYRLAEPPAGS